MSDRIRIVIADDHAPTRAGIRSVLEADGFEVCGEAASADTAVELALAERPAVCLLDINMPGGGIAAAGAISERLPETAIVMLTVSEDEDDLFAALRAGATGYLLKSMDFARLPHALADVAAGATAIPRDLMSRVVAEFRDEGPRRRAALDVAGLQLTSREWQVLDLLRLGLSTAEIAERLYVSPATVRSHVAALLRKLEAPDRAALVALFSEPDEALLR